ncbi:MAG: sigma 54-interacting transcriptional regulator [Nitrospirae bacterium]|nr:sigma 54-interacting transcriptional regulator [Nitrospirota bacterium]
MDLKKSPDTEQADSFYPSVLESIAEGIVVIGLDRKILFINSMAKALIGLQSEIVEGMSCNKVMNTDLCSKSCPLDCSDNNISCSQAAYFMNINLHKKDETSIPLCLNVAPLKDAEGNVIGIIENFRPMSEAIKAIESLEKSNVVLAQEKNKIASIINSLADGVFTVDRELRIISFNKGMENLTGLKESDVIGRACREILHADNCTGNCPFSYTLKNGYGLANIMERIAGKDGNVIPVLISTAFLKDGAQDIGLIATIRDASEIEKLKKEINDRYSFSNIIGKSVPIQQIFELIEALGDTDCAVLIEGESGTGKELVARAIHHESYRRNKPFVKVNCSAIVEGLFESELFGHVKGAFTGAIKDKIGKFELADGGTIFLDEIGEMPMSLQSKLLRVIQDKEFEKVGDTKTVKVDVRVIAATNRNLKDEIKTSNFREDLYYRLCIVPIKMPPLRERKEDIPLLINHFLEKCSLKIPNRPKIIEVTPTALSAFIDHNWPGNVRELENAIEHAYIRSKTNRIDNESLPHSITGNSLKEISNNIVEGMGGEETERLQIKALLKKYNGNKTKVAKDLGLSRTTLWRKFRKHNLHETL